MNEFMKKSASAAEDRNRSEMIDNLSKGIDALQLANIKKHAIKGELITTDGILDMRKLLTSVIGRSGLCLPTEVINEITDVVVKHILKKQGVELDESDTT